MAQPNLPAVTAIVVAAGASRRMGFDKLSYRLPDGRTVLETSCAALTAHPAITQLVLVCGGNRAACEAIAAACPKPCAVVQGGATRADSVRNGLAAATGELVAIHDAARPFVSENVITAALTAAAETGAAAPAVPGKDTGKVADPSGRGLDTPDRATLCRRRSASAAHSTPRRLPPSRGKKPALSPMIAACLSWPVCPSG